MSKEAANATLCVRFRGWCGTLSQVNPNAVGNGDQQTDGLARTMAKTLFIGADHAGFPLKQELLPFLKAKNLDVQDLGCFSADSVDYPMVAKSVADAMLANPESLGILVCGSGIGVSIGANRFPHVRAALANDLYSARMSRQHNDANVLCLGSRVIAPALAFEIVSTWLETSFEGNRHQRRVDQLTNLVDSKEGHPSCQPC